MFELQIFGCINLYNLYNYTYTTHTACSLEFFKVGYFCLSTPVTGLSPLSCNGARGMQIFEET